MQFLSYSNRPVYLASLTRDQKEFYFRKYSSTARLEKAEQSNGADKLSLITHMLTGNNINDTDSVTSYFPEIKINSWINIIYETNIFNEVKHATTDLEISPDSLCTVG